MHTVFECKAGTAESYVRIFCKEEKNIQFPRQGTITHIGTTGGNHTYLFEPNCSNNWVYVGNGKETKLNSSQALMLGLIEPDRPPVPIEAPEPISAELENKLKHVGLLESAPAQESKDNYALLATLLPPHLFTLIKKFPQFVNEAVETVKQEQASQGPESSKSEKLRLYFEESHDFGMLFTFAKNKEDAIKFMGNGEIHYILDGEVEVTEGLVFSNVQR